MAKTGIKLSIALLSLAWGAVVAFFVWSLLSIDQSDLSISLSALAGAEGRQPWQYIITFLLVAFCVWAIPTAVLWQLIREYRKAGVLTAAVALSGFIAFVIIGRSLEHTQHPDSALQNGEVGLGSVSALEKWRCKNDLEVSCLDGGCNATHDESFTPMSISITEAGELSVCAYSGCWEGDAEIVPKERFVIVVGSKLPFSTSPDPGMAEDILIAIDRSDNIALLKVDTFAQPLICEQHEGTTVIDPGA